MVRLASSRVVPPVAPHAVAMGFIGVLGTVGLPAQHAWNRRSLPGAPEPLAAVTLWSDQSAGLTHVFGVGSRSFGMWNWDGARWSRWITPTMPSSAAGRGGAYDPVRRRLVIVVPRADRQAMQTWELDANDWSLSQALSPTPRTDHVLAFDAASGRTILFGGLAGANWNWRVVDDTWAWNGNMWVRVLGTSPPARHSAAMVGDDRRGVLVLFGGSGLSQYYDDTWLWDGANWVESPTADHPTARVYSAMAYDASRGRVVLFGGMQSGYPAALDDTWEWDGSTWLRRAPAHVPPARYGHGMTYDASRGRVAMFGGGYGTLADLWEWDGTDWTLRSITTPPAASGAASTYDSWRDRVVVHGGRSAGTGTDLGTTWLWDGSNWSVAADGMRGGNQSFHAMAFDTVRGRGVMFSADTLEWDGSRWNPIAGPQPPARRSHAMAFDAVRQRVVLFGGARSPNHQDLLNDTWDWDGGVWRALTPASPPAPRAGHALAFDEARGVVVMYGGYDGLGQTDQTWEWNGTSWTRRTSRSSPPPSSYHALVYDADRRRCVAFGGSFPAGEQWEWNGIDWTRRRGTPAPGPRLAAAVAYDTARREIVVVGGALGGTVLSDCWTFGRGRTAAFATFGAGCPAGRPPVLAAETGQLPQLGTTFTLQMRNLPTNATAMLVVGASSTRFGPAPLPFDLGPLGLPGCTLYASIDGVLPCAVAGSLGTVPLRVPNDPRLAGRAAFLQGVVVDPGANAPGLTLSDGGEARFGT